MDRLLNMNGTIRSKIFEYQIIRIIRCNSALASINIQNSQKIQKIRVESKNTTADQSQSK